MIQPPQFGPDVPLRASEQQQLIDTVDSSVSTLSCVLTQGGSSWWQPVVGSAPDPFGAPIYIPTWAHEIEVYVSVYSIAGSVTGAFTVVVDGTAPTLSFTSSLANDDVMQIGTIPTTTTGTGWQTIQIKDTSLTGTPSIWYFGVVVKRLSALGSTPGPVE